MTTSGTTQNVTWHALLTHPEAVRRIGPGHYTTLPENARAPYDRRAAWYDAVVGRPLYLRIAWGTSRAAHAGFARHALGAAGDGCFAEVGCGSLLFTSDVYRDRRAGFTLLVDRSAHMLSRAQRRLARAPEASSEDVIVLHADAAVLPIQAGTFSSLLSLNLLHVPCDADAIVAECARILIPGRGRLFVSSLILSGRWSDAYLHAGHRAGEFGAPLTLDGLRQRVAEQWGVIESTNVQGNLCFLVVRHAG